MVNYIQMLYGTLWTPIKIIQFNKQFVYKIIPYNNVQNNYKIDSTDPLVYKAK